jgi:hypothetical protein
LGDNGAGSLVSGDAGTESRGRTIGAASCSATDVQNAANSASMGDIVLVPGGSCTWYSHGVSIDKAIGVRGAGRKTTNITLTGSDALTITMQSMGNIRVSGFSFLSSGGGPSVYSILIQGAWRQDQSVIFQDNDFTQSDNEMLYSTVAGGVILSHNAFAGGATDNALHIRDLVTTNSWTTADSLGKNDETGTLNSYVEDNTFNGYSLGALYCDTNCRIVVRHNTFSYGGVYSDPGLRHFEVYGNDFYYPESSSNLSNVPWFIWLQDGTGMIYDNHFDALMSQNWGTKPEIKLTIRGAEDAGTCAYVSYPVPHQIGQNNNGANDFTDPIFYGATPVP